MTLVKVLQDKLRFVLFYLYYVVCLTYIFLALCVHIVYTDDVMATLHIRIDDQLKKNAQDFFREQGTDMSHAVRVFLSKTLEKKYQRELEKERRHEALFFKTKKGQELSKKWDKEAKEALKKNMAYTTIDDMFADILE